MLALTHARKNTLIRGVIAEIPDCHRIICCGGFNDKALPPPGDSHSQQKSNQQRTKRRLTGNVA
jgi:hypothetical protein